MSLILIEKRKVLSRKFLYFDSIPTSYNSHILTLAIHIIIMYLHLFKKKQQHTKTNH